MDAEYAEMVRAEEEEATRRKELAKALAGAAEQWRDTVRTSTFLNLAFALIVINLLVEVAGEVIFFALSMLCGGVVLLTESKPSVCRSVVILVFGLAVLAALIAPGAGHLATPFFELPLCHNKSDGAQHLYGLKQASAPAVTTCNDPSQPLVITLHQRDLDADRDYRTVFLLPGQAHASLTLTVTDATGAQLYMPTRLELGPTDDFPWASIKAADAAATAMVASGAIASGAVASGASFAASSRRNRRRLRGFSMGRMGGGGFGGGGGFSRGTGSFFSPKRGVSQGPSAGGRRPVSAFGGAGRAPAAIGSPGARYYTGTPYMGGGYMPPMGYGNNLGFDIAMGMMIAHSLRAPHHRRPAILHDHSDHSTGAATAGLLPAPPWRDGSYYVAAGALHAGSVLGAANVSSKEMASPAPTAWKELHRAYDRYAVVEELRVPAAVAWPLRVALDSSRVFVPAVSTASVGIATAHASASSPSSAPTTAKPDGPPTPLYVGLQAASAPRLRATVLAGRTSKLLRHLSCMLLLSLAAVSVIGAARFGTLRRSPNDALDASSDVESTELLPSSTRRPAVGIPIGTSYETPHAANAVNAPNAADGVSSTAPPCIGADGEILAEGSRVQTQHTRARGGDDSWYAGTVLTVQSDGRHATIIYDDGVEELAPLNEVYTLQGGEQDHAQGSEASALPAVGAEAPADRSR